MESLETLPSVQQHWAESTESTEGTDEDQSVYAHIWTILWFCCSHSSWTIKQNENLHF